MRTGALLPADQDLLTLWLNRYPKTTQRAYKRDVEAFAKFVGGSPQDVAKIDPPPLFLAATKWVESIQGLSSASRARMIASVKSFFDFLEKAQVIQSNPIRAIQSPKIHNEKREVLTPEELDQVLLTVDKRTVAGKRDYCILLLMIQLGLRREEVATLTRKNLSKDSVGRTILTFIGKGDKEATMPLSKSVIDALDEYSFWTKAVSDSDPLFLTKTGKQITGDTIFDLVKKYVEKAKIPKTISPHSFRHMAITEVWRVAKNVPDVLHFSRHKRVDTALRYDESSSINAIEDIQKKRGIL